MIKIKSGDIVLFNSYSRLTGKIGIIDKSVLEQVKENIKRWLAGEKR